MGEHFGNLHAALEEMLQGLKDPANHYMVIATYFEYINSDDEDLDKYNFAVVYFHKEAVWDVLLSERSLQADVLLDRDNPSEKYRIQIPLEEIWKVQKSSNTTFTDEGTLFYSGSVFKKMLKR